MIKKMRDNKGFTLLEIVITIGILGIIVIPIFSLFVNTAKTNAMAEDKIQATMIAQKYMEKIKSSKSIEEVSISKDGDFNVNIQKRDLYSSEGNSGNNGGNTQDKSIIKITADGEYFEFNLKDYPKREVNSLLVRMDGRNLKFFYNDKSIEHIVGYKPDRGFKYHEIELKISSNINIEIFAEIHNKEGLQYDIYNIKEQKVSSNYIEGETGKPQIVKLYGQEGKDESPIEIGNIKLHEINIIVTKNNKELENLTGYVRTINGKILVP